MLDSELVSILQREIDRAESTSANIVEENRSQAFDYYHATGVARGDACMGRSNVVSNDVGDMVDALLSQMMPAFTNDMSASFEPDSAEDEEQAEEESRVVSHVFMDTNRGYNIIRDALFDALLQKNCALKVYWDKKTNKEIQKYEDLSEEEIQMLYLQAQQLDDGKKRTITGFDESEGGYTITVREEEERGAPKIEVIPPEEIRVNPDHDSACVDNARFVAHRPSNVTQSDLIEMGFDPELIDSLPGYIHNDDMGAQSRGFIGKEEHVEASSRAVRVMEVYECFATVDYDGDGVAERRRVLMCGKHILENDEVTYGQIITGAVMPLPHQFWAQSIFDKLKDLMDTKTVLVRQIIDNGAMNINNRLGVLEGAVNYDDLQTSRPGGVVRMTQQGAIFPLPKGQMDPSTPALLQYMDKMRTERAGAALDMTQENIPVGTNATAHGTERVITSMEQMQAVMVQNFAELVIREIYIHIHRLLRQHSTGPMTVKTGSEYVQVDPSQWKPRNKVNVAVGSSMGERNRKATTMQSIVMAQKEAMGMGADGVLVEMKGIYNALMDGARYAGIDFPEQYWVNPESEEAQQAAQQKQQQAAQEKQEQQAMLMGQAQLQIQMVQIAEATKQRKMEIDMISDAQERAQEYEKMMNDFTVKMTELELTHDENVPGSAV